MRDSKPVRFFQIYDGLDQALLEEKVIVRASFALALIARDKAADSECRAYAGRNVPQ